MLKRENIKNAPVLVSSPFKLPDKFKDVPEERKGIYANKVMLTALIHQIEKEYKTKNWLELSNEKREAILSKMLEQDNLLKTSIEVFMYKAKKNQAFDIHD